MKACRRKHSGQAGYTLVELMITIVVFTLVVYGLYTVFDSMHRAYINEEIKATMQQEARVGMDIMVREMMMMGYGSDTKVLSAEQDSIRFEERIKDNDGEKDWRIEYYVDANNRLMRHAISGEIPPDDIDADLIPNVESLAFEYYDKDNNPLSDLSKFDPEYDEGVPVSMLADNPGEPQYERDQIRRVTVTLTVRSGKKITTEKNPQGEYKYITLKADISPRNLWEGEASMDEEPPVFETTSSINGVGQWIKVRDTGNCGKLQAMWQKSSNPDLAGYLLKYGTTDGEWLSYKDVPATGSDTGFPTSEFDVDYNPFTGDPSDVTSGYAVYYVTVQAYDRSHNYSEEMSSVGGDDPDPSITTFTGAYNDAANTIPKPVKPAGFAYSNADPDSGAYSSQCPDGAIRLTWTPSTDPNVVGYRIYRSTSEFTTFPIDETYLIAKETETGDTWAGPRTDVGSSSSGASWEYSNGEYIDKDEAIQGCNIYYYAICCVTCDRTRIYGFNDTLKDSHHGGRYAADEYELITASSFESVPPDAAGLTARAGWKRVFLQTTWPTGDANSDYDYTEIWFKRGAADASDLPDINSNDPSVGKLIPDREEPTYHDFPGRFKDYGTSAEGTIVFNADGDSDLADTASPTLNNDINYSFLAVSYDKCGNPSTSTDFATTFAELCGDDPCGAPRWKLGTTNAKVWVNPDPNVTNLDASTWNPGAPDGNTQINIGLTWTDLDKTDINTALDFYGYVVSRDVSSAGSFTYNVATTEWNSYVLSAGLLEGQNYCYRVRATDCVWQNITVDDSVDCGGNTYYYSDIKTNNITPLVNLLDPDNEALKLDNIKPGKVRKYRDASAPFSISNFAYTSEEFHQNVNFFIQNTSGAHLILDEMAVRWENESVKLVRVKFYGTSDTPTTEEFNVSTSEGVLFPLGTGRWIQDIASSSTTPSGPMRVEMMFVNTDGTVNELSDMRGDFIEWEMKFTNLSMPANESHTTYVGGFTTGAVNDPFRTRNFRVSTGPSINIVRQNQPVNPTTPTVVTEDALPAIGIPEVPGTVPVRVAANVTKPSSETLGGVELIVYITDTTSTNVSGSTAVSIPMSQSGNDFTAVIPGQDDKRIWYKVRATSNQGTVVNSPLRNNEYYHYLQLPFDVCYLTPDAPGNLAFTSDGTNVTFTWDAPTDYEEGIAIPPEDTIVYDLYRRAITGTFPSTPFVSDITDTTYVTPLGATTYVYAVKARNSCVTEVRESVNSNEVIVCAGAGCSVTLNQSSIMVDTNWTTGSQAATILPLDLTVSICDRAGDHSWWAAGPGFDALAGDFVDNSPTSLSDIIMRVESTAYPGQYADITLFEINDSGIFTMTGTQDAGIFINPLNSAYSNTFRNTAPVALDSQRTFGATKKTIPDDTLTFTTDAGIAGCASVSTTLAVSTDPCANTPNPTSITSGARSANNDLTMAWSAVTTNTDGSPSTSSTDAVSYEIWFAFTPETNPDNFALLTTTASTSLTLYAMPTSSHLDINFFVKVVDNCSPTQNKSNISNIVAVPWKGSATP